MLFAALALLDSASMNATTTSVHHGRRQKLEIADLELAGVFDENDLQLQRIHHGEVRQFSLISAA
jgi:hypothetical protein